MTTPDPAPKEIRPTAEDLMGEYSFPASDPPATWTWDVKRPAAVDAPNAVPSSQ